MALNSKLYIGLMAAFTRQIASDEHAMHRVLESWEQTLTDGTGDNQGDFIYHTAGTVTEEGVTIDMQGGGLTDAFGQSLNPDNIRMVAIRNSMPANASAANLTVGGTWGNVSGVIPRGGVLVGACGAGSEWTTTAGESDTITLTGAGVTYELILIGVR
jgi:hypothetical protein